MEEEVLDIVAEVLECAPGKVGLDTPLPELEQWSSLLHLILVSRVEERFSAEIPMEAIPDIRTPRDLLAYL